MKIPIRPHSPPPPIALTIAGSDSSGGAGIQADLKTFSAMGVYGASVVTAVTVQNSLGVTDVHEVPADMVAAQIKAVLCDLDVAAIKIGMLFSVEIVEAVVGALNGCDIPIVLDPVMIATSGRVLLHPAAVEAMVAQLFPLAGLVTPNLPEAARLLGQLPAQTIQQMKLQAHALLALGPAAVLLKGGHAEGAVSRDLFCPLLGDFEILEAPRQATKNTHGTGCTLSAAIAAGLAHGQGQEVAVRAAHGYLQGAIGAADQLNVGAGRGPVHHFHAMWQ
ncbi:bifunctional hydroxymethylpyrimidine kinase/phosphomethylpyrimidine kinase [Candidatus Halocynthiibacter alkanivorans]|uniref:bifunctional hydroxymethylpyrimidine kinase/phosphomethylpyrimidine kinase n=1 Tax=Candidatus Halocynthiibacter alkanivorans TaxID=2267619 RepID=UPI000DF35717|nr:bifunctional hydroxymethylpyrimidine kinase/phosphomethylpyrimidine kinase [Candidatus Halocynthiibacter alkanivorans]